MSAWLSTIASVLFGAVLGFGARRLDAWFDRRRRVRTIRVGLHAEVSALRDRLRELGRVCQTMIDTQDEPQVLRVGITPKVYEANAGSLGDLVDEKHIATLVEFYGRLEQTNVLGESIVRGTSLSRLIRIIGLLNFAREIGACLELSCRVDADLRRRVAGCGSVEPDQNERSDLQLAKDVQTRADARIEELAPVAFA